MMQKKPALRGAEEGAAESKRAAMSGKQTRSEEGSAALRDRISAESSARSRGTKRIDDWQPESLLGAMGLEASEESDGLSGAQRALALAAVGDMRGENTVQRKTLANGIGASEDIHQTAKQGVAGAGAALPHAEQIQRSFGAHDLSDVQAHVGGAAAGAAHAMGASAYATGQSVAFVEPPSLHLAAHEAAHVVQQRAGVQLKGGVGAVGDSYERHADAVADLVIQGKSAESLLGEVAPLQSSSSSVQRKELQFSIKGDLRDAMAGWGTDEDKIFARLRGATAAELRSVLADSALMSELRGELDQGDMARVLDSLNAPLADKLCLAMDGWGTDEDYLHRSLASASPSELLRIAADTALVDRLESELSGSDLRRVLDRVGLPLSRKLEYAIRGWGTDESYIFSSVKGAAVAEVLAVASNAALMNQIDGDLSGAELDQWRGLMARRIYESGDLLLAFKMVLGSDTQRRARLTFLGGLDVQRRVCEQVLATSSDDNAARQAFRSYWENELPGLPSVDGIARGALQPLGEQIKLLLHLEKQAEPAFRARVGAMSKTETEALRTNLSWFQQTRFATLLSRILNERLVASAEGLNGQLYWAGSSAPDPLDGYQIKQTTQRPTDGDLSVIETNTNEFAVWVRGGAEPTTSSKMNCWEMVLFAGYQAGVIPKAWIVQLHNDAAAAGVAAVSEGAYYAVLENALRFSSATNWTPGTAIPRGDIVFFGGLEHVALSTGATVGGKQEIMSLWVLPVASSGALNSVTQRTTIEDLQANGIGVTIGAVKHGPNPWH